MKSYHLHFFLLSRRRELLILAALFLSLAALVWLLLYRDVYFPGQVLRVAAPDMEIFQGRLSPYGSGPQRDLLEKFCAEQGIEARWLPISNWEDGWRLLRQGRADLLLGHGAFPPENLASEGIIEGPVLAESQAFILHNRDNFGPKAPFSPCDTPFFYQHSPAIEAVLKGLCQDDGEQTRGSPMESVSLLPMFEALVEGGARLGVVDEASFRLWQPLFPQLQSSKVLSTAIQTRWYISSRREWLAEALMQYLSGDSLAHDLSRLESRYWGFFPQDTSAYEIGYIRRVVRTVLPRYKKTILEAAKRERIDPLLLAAVIYQESRFRSRARSHTGVRGLMQLNMDTARMLGVTNRLDPLQSIQGGSSYLRRLNDRLKPLIQDPWERWFLTFAAYNQGFGHLEDAMKLARKQRLAPDHWRDVKKALKLLTKKKYYKEATYGYTRGFEAEAYVDSIRYFYYVLYSLTLVPGPEADQLAPFVNATPAGWPDV
ncbi:putative soluble lytic transglycosylase fused to an ABC-type amino acid-binding protein [Desulfocurvibacter africanus PCS]|uniref:Putative soluble lytic transglycosylase fused to an ABC-type amino acid-binding protein n=1 Tax=Desulfocurvibacter africanus PCS TaxID=1262666 RepID=M5PUP1_DESAF|nr:transglycosylase SLT domain-containing protein [Desulfocurvibacter africanus]EMG37794.1 putative soluble lytic transglycosylase fused to an ABC-type amino acid-binding protein [Desulfocurvibacter africanus PCS]